MAGPRTIDRRSVIKAGAAIATVGGVATPALAAAGGDPDQVFIELIHRHRETMRAWERLGESETEAAEAIKHYCPRVYYGNNLSRGGRTPRYARSVDQLMRETEHWCSPSPTRSAETIRKRTAWRDGLAADLRQQQAAYDAQAEAVGLRRIKRDAEALWQTAKRIEAEIRDRPAAGYLGIAVKVRFFLENYAEGSEVIGWRWETSKWGPAEQVLANAYADAARLGGRLV